MEVSGDKRSTQIFLDISPLFFHIVSKLVQAPVIIYDEIFHARVVEGDIPLPKPFLDPTLPTTQLQLSPHGLSCNWQTKKNISEASDFYLMTPSKPKSRSHFWTLAFTVSSDGNCQPWR
jgi:hypothetical protein